MKTILALFAAFLALFAAPALAAPNSNFVGPRIDVSAGFDDLTKYRDAKVSYGASAGVDVPLGSRITAGLQASVANVFDRKDIGADFRLGYAVTDNLLLYGTAGYASVYNQEGVRVGGGAEIASGGPLYTKIEYRYTDLDRDVGRHEGLVGIGLRF